MFSRSNRNRFSQSASAHLVLAASTLLAVSSAFAIEAVETEIPASTLTRQQVQSELARAQADNPMLSRGEANDFFELTLPAQRNRKEVRVEAELAARARQASPLFIGG